ncbi:hypothetical protein ACJJTC_016894 [Scirpophaga incertulas]
MERAQGLFRDVRMLARDVFCRLHAKKAEYSLARESCTNENTGTDSTAPLKRHDWIMMTCVIFFVLHSLRKKLVPKQPSYRVDTGYAARQISQASHDTSLQHQTRVNQLVGPAVGAP